MRLRLLIATIALLSACSDKPAPPAAQPSGGAMTSAPPAQVGAAPDLLSAEGIGAVRFGITLAQIEQALGASAVLPQSFDPACSMVRLPGLPRLRFMVENGVVTRADAEAGVASAVGAIGDTLAQVRGAHPEARISPHKYDPGGHYLSFPSADGRAAIILEAAGGKVTGMRAGLQPAVAYVETCG